MTNDSPEHIVAGSRREAAPGTRRVGDADPHDPVQVTVILRRAAPRSGAPAESDELTLVERFAATHGLSVTSTSPAARSVGLRGSVAQMNAAFGVRLGRYTADGESFRGREGDVRVPPELAGVVVAVLGLDERPQTRAHFRIARDPAGAGRTEGVSPRAATSGYPPAEVARRYGFPDGADGAGQTVAVIELGGGYRAADLAEYFAAQGVRAPQVTAVSVDGARNAPGGDADGEVMLDIEVIGAIAPGAHIVVYFAPNTTNGFYDAVAAALHDTRRKPSVISISWGEAESGWTAQAMDSYDALFADAGALGVTVYAAAGDDGSRDNATGDNVDFPASSPHVVGCGGTTLSTTGEVVWNDSATGNGATGGGVSVHFAAPEYQAGAEVPANPAGATGRGVPDVAGDADPLTGYQVRVDGRDAVIGGTSAVAPLWAALTALSNQLCGAPAGQPHERLYAHPAAFVDITSGDNGRYRARPGWDPCTGLGSPRGDQIVQVLGGVDDMLGRRWWAIAFAVLAVGALACNGAEGAGGDQPGGPGRDPGSHAPVAGLPASMAAIGDSITVGYGSCFTLTDCPRNSWSTGDGVLVDSHYRRILAGNPAIKGHATNYAASGATAAGLAGQAERAAAGRPDYLTIMIGANDACRTSMTPVATFAAQIDAALSAIRSRSPKTRILVVSIPDVYRVWEVGHTSAVARAVWKLGICPSLLANPTSTAAADVARRQAFRDRIDAYDREMSSACGGYGHLCRWDGGAVHRTSFGLGQLSALDFFHPNSSGQNEIARVTYPSSFTW